MYIKKMNKKMLALTIAASLSLLGCEKAPKPAVDTGERINLQAIYSVTQNDINKIAESQRI